MSEERKNRIIVVLGMHRSGTSAVTRGLQAIGVELGDCLTPPAPGNNEKGFFEDREILQLNTELLDALGSDWHSLSIIPSSALGKECIAPLKLRASELLLAKMGNKPFGLKDPRIGRLLPFWQCVFGLLNVTPSYVIAIRHPLSVMQSLQKRDGFDNEKSCYLWLEHILPALLETVGSKRVVVDFDLLLADPKWQLKRIADAVDLPFNPDSPGVQEYVSEFLDARLCHSQFEFDDLRSNSDAPLDAINAYCELMRVARDEIHINEQEVAEKFGELNSRLQSMRPALNYISRLERHKIDPQGRITNLTGKISNLNGLIASLRGQVASLRGQVASLSGKIANLHHAVLKRDQQIASLKQAVLKRDQQIASLKQAVVKRDGQINGLLNSRSWRLTKPLRLLWRLFI